MKKHGFSLVELLIVLLILGVLVGLAVPRYMESQKAARARTFAANVREIVGALEAYRVDNALGSAAKYPDNLQVLRQKGYFTQEPFNPYTGVSMLDASTDTSSAGITYTATANGLKYVLKVTQSDLDDIDNDDATEETLCEVEEVKPMLPSSACQ
mgnify:CR=1 FL=1